VSIIIGIGDRSRLGVMTDIRFLSLIRLAGKQVVSRTGCFYPSWEAMTECAALFRPTLSTVRF
jgi:hypothetical protein